MRALARAKRKASSKRRERLALGLRLLPLLILDQSAIETLELLDPLDHLDPPVAVRLLQEHTRRDKRAKA